jgi:hypothetical protein
MAALHKVLASMSATGSSRCRPTLRSTGRAGSRLQLGAHRRGPPVSLFRWAVGCSVMKMAGYSGVLVSALPRVCQEPSVLDQRGNILPLDGIGTAN